MGGRQGKANGIRNVPAAAVVATTAASSVADEQRAAWAKYDERVKAAEEARDQLFKSLKGLSKEDLLNTLRQSRRISVGSEKDSKTDLKYAITSAAHPSPKEPRFPRP